ncbi:MAG: glutathione S-transferase family protein [Hyphomonadaceae bacterium]|nr:MAG: glutathione S-transferase [Caulobacteraceae bacterium]MBT9446400.1 glutathione S-transferase family protein [Hyphomonadaceae bacterium]
MTTLYGWGPMFDLPGPSPYVMKADIQMQMLGAPFTRALAELDSVAKHKAPYVVDDGVLIEDSTFIRMHFERKLGKDLDECLTPAQRGQAWAVERLLEDRLGLIMVCERWLVDANFDKGPSQFFADVPEAMRAQVISEVRGGVAASMKGHGIGRHSREERMLLAERDVGAVAAMLGEGPFLFGAKPTAADAVAYGVLAACGTPFFSTPLVALIDAQPNLRPYLARMEARFVHEAAWPSMAA